MKQTVDISLILSEIAQKVGKLKQLKISGFLCNKVSDSELVVISNHYMVIFHCNLIKWTTE